MSLTGDPEGAPMKVGVGIADLMTGIYAAVGILTALRRRDTTGEGGHIDLSLLDTQIAWRANAATNCLLSGGKPAWLGNGHPNILPYQVFATADAPMILAVGNDMQFRHLCECAGLTDCRGLLPDKTEAAQAKIFAAEMANRVTSDALQLFGSSGDSRPLPLERHVRDARLFAIAGDTAQILRTQVAGSIRKRKLPRTRAGYLELAQRESARVSEAAGG